jgi:putative DNA-invertase from lambdoid prophage Rac
MQTLLYARVSSADQTIEHQETQARAAGFAIDKVIADEGVSGISMPLKDRPNGKRLFDILRRGDLLIVRWVDRLGRDYQDVCDNIRQFTQRGVIVRTVINGLTFDGATKDPMQKAVRDALIGFMAALSQAQAEATKEAQRAGIAHAKAHKEDPYKGRKPSFTRKQYETVRTMLAEGASVSVISKACGTKADGSPAVTRQTIYRIRDNAAWAASALERWKLSKAA